MRWEGQWSVERMVRVEKLQGGVLLLQIGSPAG